jgi:hypothetical protein
VISRESVAVRFRVQAEMHLRSTSIDAFGRKDPTPKKRAENSVATTEIPSGRDSYHRNVTPRLHRREVSR